MGVISEVNVQKASLDLTNRFNKGLEAHAGEIRPPGKFQKKLAEYAANRVAAGVSTPFGKIRCQPKAPPMLATKFGKKWPNNNTLHTTLRLCKHSQYIVQKKCRITRTISPHPK